MTQSHWDDRYRTVGEQSVSWFESEPRVSLRLIDLVGATPTTSVIDIGGGASPLTARLQEQGFADLTVLDISAEALEASRAGWSDPTRWPGSTPTSSTGLPPVDGPCGTTEPCSTSSQTRQIVVATGSCWIVHSNRAVR